MPTRTSSNDSIKTRKQPHVKCNLYMIGIMMILLQSPFNASVSGYHDGIVCEGGVRPACKISITNIPNCVVEEEPMSTRMNDSVCGKK